MKDIHTFVILAYNESDNLEECIKSVLNQSVKSNVIIATSTENDYIKEVASFYGIGVMVNHDVSNKGNDYNFAINTFDTELVTIAHQDDLYDRNYLKEIISFYENNQEATFIFTDYYEIVGDRKVIYNKNLLKKRYFNGLLKYKCLQNKKIIKRRALKYINSICTSSVTFVKKNIKKNIFGSSFVYNNDWNGFLKLSNDHSSFAYLPKKLVGYRIIDKKEDITKIKEDITMYKKMWPDWLIDFIYKKRENKREKIRRVF